MLKEYKDKHGDCNVPKGWSENKQLGEWVDTQRIYYKGGKISDDRVKRLNELDFVWYPYESAWEEGFNALKEYKKTYGHCNVPQAYMVDNIKLGKWVSKQRSKKERLSDERIKRLEDIGFVWKILK